MAERAGFSEYVVARRPLMYRTAWVLCGDHHQAEDLVQHVLTKLYVAWPRVVRIVLSRFSSAGTYRRIAADPAPF